MKDLFHYRFFTSFNCILSYVLRSYFVLCFKVEENVGKLNGKVLVIFCQDIFHFSYSACHIVFALHSFVRGFLG